jgi:hypothetical protein
VIVCVVGALGALSAARYVVVFGTALAGAWTLILGALALMGNHDALHAASSRDVWILYPLVGRWWHTALWVGLSLAGVVVQLATTGRGGRARTRRKRDAA